MATQLNPNTKIIFVTGGVYSSLGKGIITSSLAAVLQKQGNKVMALKLDPYLNVDAGTMSPEQHGEVFVTHDGNETDLDIGNYERFLNIDLPKEANITAGKIYFELLQKERSGVFLGATIQVIPHVIDLINAKIIGYCNAYHLDFLVVEIGGTVGDIESIPFIEALRQIKTLYPKQVLISQTVPIIALLTDQEQKTKPLQHSVKALMSFGLFPDLLFIRSQNLVNKQIKAKIALTTGVQPASIITAVNVPYIYLLIEAFEQQKIISLIYNYFQIPVESTADNKISQQYDHFLQLIKAPKPNQAKIALIGKYNQNKDVYLSILASLDICAFYLGYQLDVQQINACLINEDSVKEHLQGYDGLIIPGGFGERDVFGKLCAIQHARTHKLPFFGICLGLQLACIEFARNVLNLKDANSTEFNPYTKNPVISMMAEQKEVTNMGGTLRLGNYQCQLAPNSLAFQAYQKKLITERHRHRYEFNNAYLPLFTQNGFVFSGISAYQDLVEIIELPTTQHPFFLATQFHPEFTTKIFSPHPLFLSFLKACQKA